MREFADQIRLLPHAGANRRAATFAPDGTIEPGAGGILNPAAPIKEQSNNSWSNYGPSTQVYTSYKLVHWSGCKLFSSDGATEYATIDGGNDGVGGWNVYLSAYPDLSLSGIDLMVERDMSAYLGSTLKPTFLGSGVKFGDGGGVLLFPYGMPAGGLATGYRNANANGGGALIASIITDDSDKDDTTAVATWNRESFDINGTLGIHSGRTEYVNAFDFRAFNNISADQTILYSILQSRWRYTGSGGHTLTLPQSGGLAPTWARFEVKNAGTGDLTIQRGHSSNSIEGAASLTLPAGAAVTLSASTTTRWEIMASHGL